MRLAKNYPKRSLFRILKKKVYATVFSRKEIMYKDDTVRCKNVFTCSIQGIL